MAARRRPAPNYAPNHDNGLETIVNKSDVIGPGALESDVEAVADAQALIVAMGGKGARDVPSAGGILGIPSGRSSIMHFRYLHQH